MSAIPPKNSTMPTIQDMSAGSGIPSCASIAWNPACCAALKSFGAPWYMKAMPSRMRSGIGQ
jgi:hypothetical protein